MLQKWDSDSVNFYNIHTLIFSSHNSSLWNVPSICWYVFNEIHQFCYLSSCLTEVLQYKGVTGNSVPKENHIKKKVIEMPLVFIHGLKQEFISFFVVYDKWSSLSTQFCKSRPILGKLFCVWPLTYIYSNMCQSKHDCQNNKYVHIV